MKTNVQVGIKLIKFNFDNNSIKVIPIATTPTLAPITILHK